MVEILYPILDRAVIITVLNLDGYYENTIFNNIIRVLDTKNTAYLLMKGDRNVVGNYARTVSAVIFCDEETSKKYKDISYKYWICAEILKRTEYEYITEELIYRPNMDTPDTNKYNQIKHIISESKSMLNKIYKTTLLKNSYLIYVHKAHEFLRTPELDGHESIAHFDKHGEIYRFYVVNTSEYLNNILNEAAFYNNQITSPSCKDDKYIDIKFLTYVDMERHELEVYNEET